MTEATNLPNWQVGSNGGRVPLIISEPGLYKLVMRSRKPEAKEFQRWVTHEVLPSIRKHGAYMTQQTLDKALTSPDFLIPARHQAEGGAGEGQGTGAESQGVG